MDDLERRAIEASKEVRGYAAAGIIGELLQNRNLGWQRNKECLKELNDALAREVNLLREWHKALTRAERAEQRCKLKLKKLKGKA